MNFNHFSFIEDDLDLDKAGMTKLLRRLLQRHCALQLSPKQSHWDLLLPVYFGALDKELDADLLSAVVVQVKNRKKGMP